MQFISRRFFCRAAFVSLCLLPTLFIIGRIVATSLPTYVVSYEQYLSNLLGRRVTLGDVFHLRPGNMSVDSLQIYDEETGEILMTVASASITTCREETVVQLKQPRLTVGCLHEGLRSIHDRLLGRPHAIPCRVNLSASQLVVEHEAGETIIYDVKACYRPTTTHSFMTFYLRFDKMQTSEPYVIQLVRNHNSQPPETSFVFRTNGSPLACSNLWMFVPAIYQLGDQCLFNGEVQAVTDSNDDWQGGGDFRLTGVDLNRLVSGTFPQKLSGIADLTCEEMTFQRGRLTQCHGSVVAYDGEIGGSLLVSAQRGMGLRRAGDVQRPPESVGYEDLFIEFQLDDEGLQLRGRSDSEPPGAILSGPGGVLLREPSHQPLPMMGLARLLVPIDGIAPYLVPATRETDGLLRYLPIPPQFRNTEQAEVPPGRLERMQ